MTRRCFAAALSLLLGGCGLVPPTHLGGISATVAPIDYGRRLCAHLDPESYSSCVSQVLDEIERGQPARLPPGYSTSGPFAVIMDGQVYIGDYRSSPFKADFRVSNGTDVCRGGYNAFTGSADAIFDVYCDDGRSGWADIIRASDGRNGIGKIALDDGTEATLSSVICPSATWGKGGTIRFELRSEE
jgi:hypothetical protein